MSRKPPIAIVLPVQVIMSGMSEPRTVSLLDTTALSEKKMVSVPSVTMNGGSLSRVTRKPFERAHRGAADEARAAARAGRACPARCAKFAIRIEEKTAIAPTDRSMPAVRMISVWPSASTAITVTWASTRREVGRREEPAVQERERDDRHDQHGERSEDRVGVQDVLDPQADRVALVVRRSRRRTRTRPEVLW